MHMNWELCKKGVIKMTRKNLTDNELKLAYCKLSSLINEHCNNVRILPSELWDDVVIKLSEALEAMERELKSR